MGFGMRKEDYKRKPKKPSKKLKRYDKIPLTHGSDASRQAFKTYQKIRFKPAYKRLWFRVLALVIIATTLYTFLDNTVFEEQRVLKALTAFEQGGIHDFYQAELSTFDSLVTFVKSRKGKVGSIETDYPNGLEMTVRSADYHNLVQGIPNPGHHRSDWEYKYETLEREIIEGKLRYFADGSAHVYEDYWSCTMPVRTVADINNTFLQHLETSHHELGAIFDIVYHKGYEIRDMKSGIVIQFDRYDRTFLLAFTDSPDSIRRRNKREFSPLASGVYWVRDYLW
jgi:hypothetical protein